MATTDGGGLPLGMVTPIVSMNPRVAADWESSATPEDLLAVARAADRLGYHHLTCSDHVAVPAGATSSIGTRRGTRYYDPATTLAWLAASTERIGLATHVLVAGYHHPLAVAKAYGTLDVLSGGRVVLGVGIGSLEQEFAALGVPFEDRAARADGFLVALRAAWGRSEVDGLVVDPCATSTEPELWIGGRSGASLRRALGHGTGWVPFGLDDDALRARLDAARDTPLWAGRRTPFQLVLAAEDLDPMGDPAGAAERLGSLVGLGATVVDARVRHRSRVHLVEQLEALAAVARRVTPAPAA